MIVKINNKEHEVDFTYNFVKFLMAQKGWTKFSEYDAWKNKLAFKEDEFAPEHFDFAAELTYWGISAAKQQKSKLKLDVIAGVLWSDMDLFRAVMAYFADCQPKTKEVVDPASRDLGKQ